MTVGRAFLEGVRRVNRAPAVLAGVALATLLLALPLGLTLRGMIRDDLGASVMADAAAGAVNTDWWPEFLDRARGLGKTFTPEIIGFAAVLSNLSAFLDNRPQAVVIAGAGAAYVLVWMFLAGGILDRYARGTPTRTHGFFAACGVFFFRFLRLGVLAWVAYYVLFRWIHGWIFDTLFPWMTRDFTVERSAFVIRVILYGVFGALLLAVNLVFDYAKVRAVVEDRRSMIGALLAGGRFVRRNAGGAAGLYLLDGALFVVVVALYGVIAPGAGSGGAMIWLSFLVGQLYLLGRLWVKLLFYASATSLFQGRLAHADYIAGPEPVWPESPAAEAIGQVVNS